MKFRSVNRLFEHTRKILREDKILAFKIYHFSCYGAFLRAPPCVGRLFCFYSITINSFIFTRVSKGYNLQ